MTDRERFQHELKQLNEQGDNLEHQLDALEAAGQEEGDSEYDEVLYELIGLEKRRMFVERQLWNKVD